MNLLKTVVALTIMLMTSQVYPVGPFIVQNNTDVWLDVSLGGRSSSCGRRDIHGLNPSEQTTVTIPGRHGQSSSACCVHSVDVHWNWEKFAKHKWGNEKHFYFSGASGCWDDMHIQLSWQQDKEGNIIRDSKGDPIMMLKSWGISKLS